MLAINVFLHKHFLPIVLAALKAIFMALRSFRSYLWEQQLHIIGEPIPRRGQELEVGRSVSKGGVNYFTTY